MAELGLSVLQDHALSRRICSQCNAIVADATSSNESIRRFPGTMPMSLSRRHMHMIAKNDYVMLEKSDGVRYLMLVLSDFVSLLDRRMRVFVVEPNPTVPSYANPAVSQENTLLDGELTFNLALERWEYLIYDVVAIDGDTSVAKLDFRQRLRAAESYVAAPRVFSPLVSGLLRLRVKDYYEKRSIRTLFDHVLKNPKGEYIYKNNNRRDGILCNLNDGVIFAPCQMPYVVGSCSALLKWKPPHLNSIDFELQLEKIIDPRTDTPSVRSFIAFRSEKGNVQLREVYFPSKLKRKWAAAFDVYNKSIVELSYDRGGGEWRYIRQRDDKDTPNFSKTVIDTMESIAESMDREELTTFLERNSLPIPSSAESIVNEQAAACDKCTFTNDLFDENNPSYIATTPMSLVLPPFVPPTFRPKRSDGRGRGTGTERESSHHADFKHKNGVSEPATDPSPVDSGPKPVVYEDV